VVVAERAAEIAAWKKNDRDDLSVPVYQRGLDESFYLHITTGDDLHTTEKPWSHNSQQLSTVV
jgi:hypothetical protein